MICTDLAIKSIVRASMIFCGMSNQLPIFAAKNAPRCRRRPTWSQRLAESTERSLPSGDLLLSPTLRSTFTEVWKDYGKIHLFFMGKIWKNNYFDWAIFHSYVTNYRRVDHGSATNQQCPVLVKTGWGRWLIITIYHDISWLPAAKKRLALNPYIHQPTTGNLGHLCFKPPFSDWSFRCESSSHLFDGTSSIYVNSLSTRDKDYIYIYYIYAQ